MDRMRCSGMDRRMPSTTHSLMLNIMSISRNAFIPVRDCEGEHSLWNRLAEENRVDGDIPGVLYRHSSEGGLWRWRWEEGREKGEVMSVTSLEEVEEEEEEEEEQEEEEEEEEGTRNEERVLVKRE